MQLDREKTRCQPWSRAACSSPRPRAAINRRDVAICGFEQQCVFHEDCSAESAVDNHDNNDAASQTSSMGTEKFAVGRHVPC